jgi:large subunit ribosomal protein L25
MKKIEVKKRELVGSKAKQVMKDGFLPAVIYNSKQESHNVKVERGVIESLIRTATSTTILDVDFEGKDMKVILKNIDRHPRTDIMRHVSMYQVDESKPMVFSVPFEIVGIAPAVKNNVGVLVNALNSIDVKCLPKDLVSTIKIDISNLEHPGQSIIVSDIKLPEGLTLPNEEQINNAIVTITEVQKQVVIEEETEGEEGEEGETAEGEAPDGEASEEEAKEE